MSTPSDPLVLWLPLAYWLRTRLQETGQRLQYAFAVLGPQIVWLQMLSEEASVLIAFGIGFFALICIYELGYITNDHWAQKRERSAGIHVRKAEPTHVPLHVIFCATVVRVSVAAVLVVIFDSMYGGGGLISIYLLALLFVFLAHNAVIGAKRVITFFLLYWLRLSFPILVASVVISTPSFAATAAWATYSLTFALGFTMAYGVKKKFLKAPLYIAQLGGIELPLLFTSSLMLTTGVIGMLIGWTEFSAYVLHPAIWHVTYWLVWASLRFVFELRTCLQRARFELSHCHTNYSHDGSITLEDYRIWLAQDMKRTVKLTDHAEDFHEDTYERLQREYAPLGSRVSIGLEFPVERQHILAHNLKKFVDVERLPVEDSIQLLNENAESIVWAHPRFRLRALASKRYLSDMFTILALSDGVEIYNPKNVRRWRYRLMMPATAWLGGALYGRKTLYLGVDAHHPEELPALNSWRPPKTF